MKNLILMFFVLSLGNHSFAGGDGPGNSGVFPEGGMSLHGIHLEESTFADVTKRFGASKRTHTGDGAIAEEYICYLSKDRTQALYFTSSSTGGGIVDGITIKTATIHSLNECRVVNVDFKFNNGLKKGSSTTQLSQTLGKPTTNGFKVSSFNFIQVFTSENLEFERNLRVKVIFNTQEVIEEIEVYQTTVN